MPWLGIEPATFWLQADAPTNWATLIGAHQYFYTVVLSVSLGFTGPCIHHTQHKKTSTQWMSKVVIHKETGSLPKNTLQKQLGIFWSLFCWLLQMSYRTVVIHVKHCLTFKQTFQLYFIRNLFMSSLGFKHITMLFLHVVSYNSLYVGWGKSRFIVDQMENSITNFHNCKLTFVPHCI